MLLDSEIRQKFKKNQAKTKKAEIFLAFFFLEGLINWQHQKEVVRKPR